MIMCSRSSFLLSKSILATGEDNASNGLNKRETES